MIGPYDECAAGAAARPFQCGGQLQAGPRIGGRCEIGARGGDVIPQARCIRWRQARQQGPSMRQLARRNAGRRHGRDESHRDDVLEQDGGLMPVEGPIDDVSESARGVGHGQGAGRIRHAYTLILQSVLRKVLTGRVVRGSVAPLAATDGSPPRIELDHKTVIPTHLPGGVSLDSEVLAGAAGGLAVCVSRLDAALDHDDSLCRGQSELARGLLSRSTPVTETDEYRIDEPGHASRIGEAALENAVSPRRREKCAGLGADERSNRLRRPADFVHDLRTTRHGRDQILQIVTAHRIGRAARRACDPLHR